MKLGLILVAMFVLTVVSNSNSQTPSAKVPPKPAQTSQTVPKVLEEPTDEELDAAQKGDAWMRAAFADLKDGHKRVVFQITSLNHLRISKSAKLMTLNVICDRGDISVGLQVGAPANADVAIQVDDAHPFRERWLPGGDLLLAPSPSTLLSQAVDAEVLKIKFVPIGREVIVIAFKMSNLKELIAREKVCHK